MYLFHILIIVCVYNVLSSQLIKYMLSPYENINLIDNKFNKFNKSNNIITTQLNDKKDDDDDDIFFILLTEIKLSNETDNKTDNETNKEINKNITDISINTINDIFKSFGTLLFFVGVIRLI